MNKPRYTIADVRRSYDATRARAEWYGDWASALIYRPISFWVTLALLRLSVGATSVTLAMIALALSLPVLAAFSGPHAHAAVASLAFVCMVLDCVDGNIARTTGTSSDMGAYLDFLADTIYRIALYGTLGYLAHVEPAAPAILSGYAFPAAILAACLVVGARLCRFRQGLPAARSYYSADNAARARGAAIVARYVFPVLSGADRILPLLVMASAWCGGLGWIVLWLAVCALADFIYTQVLVIGRLRKRA